MSDLRLPEPVARHLNVWVSIAGEHVFSKNCNGSLRAKASTCRVSLKLLRCEHSSIRPRTSGGMTVALQPWRSMERARTKTPAKSLTGNAATLRMTTYGPHWMQTQNLRVKAPHGSSTAVQTWSGERPHCVSKRFRHRHARQEARLPAEGNYVAHVRKATFGGSTTLTLKGGSRDTTSPGRTARVADDLGAGERWTQSRATTIATTAPNQSHLPTTRNSLVTDAGATRQRRGHASSLKTSSRRWNDATRRKCTSPPFPDTYFAKESAPGTELHLN